ncbi:hypothetical protein QBC32DRAFT_314516 [Pseudoneurospora amorphoporcata]|uniref:Uncharacterized protein n=1 Tax=Pseudoneurospora amorphoporcata TaxID=241081 RepID=A0AAN6SG11_9PEZI|nr:hypothetical protein QBC32DRAFT_314516 [Pseudoneurospora amorphoporcata]
MSSTQQRPPLRRSDPGDALPPALRHENAEAIDINGDQLVNQLSELVDLMNFLSTPGDDPAIHITQQEVDVPDIDPVPTYNPFPGKGEKTIDASSAYNQHGHHPTDAPPRYRKPRNRLQKRRPNHGH